MNNQNNPEANFPRQNNPELESLRIEYQNLFDRSNKLDNKAYITVTFRLPA